MIARFENDISSLHGFVFYLMSGFLVTLYLYDKRALVTKIKFYYLVIYLVRAGFSLDFKI